MSIPTEITSYQEQISVWYAYGIGYADRIAYTITILKPGDFFSITDENARAYYANNHTMGPPDRWDIIWPLGSNIISVFGSSKDLSACPIARPGIDATYCLGGEGADYSGQGEQFISVDRCAPIETVITFYDTTDPVTTFNYV